MRRLILLAALPLSACAIGPPPQPQTPAAPPVAAQPQVRTEIAGLTAADLMHRFGRPALQVREGPGLKLQFRGQCVLDAYLYAAPGGGGPERVTHVDTRFPSGADAPADACIATLQGP